MKKTRTLFAGMAALIMAVSFASCGAAESAEEAETAAAAVPVNRSVGIQPDEANAEAAPSAETGAPSELKAILEAAAAGDRAAFETATGKDNFFAMMKKVNPGAPEDEICSDEDWNAFVDDSYPGLVIALDGLGKNVEFTAEPMTEEESKQMGYDSIEVPLTAYNVKVTSVSGEPIPMICLVFDLGDGKQFTAVNLADNVLEAQAETADANAKTLFNIALQICAESAEAGNPIADGMYTYTIGEKYDDEMGSFINEVFGEMKGAVCEIKIENGDAVYALYTPAGQDELVGMYPLEDTASEFSAADGNAKTLYNIALQVWTERHEANDPLADGDYTYTVGEKYDDDLGSFINEVFAEEKGAVCEIKIKEDDVVYAKFTPAGQDEAGMYPSVESGSEQNTADSNAKTLYNIGLQVCYESSEAGKAVADGTYTYTVGEKNDDGFGKMIDEVYGCEDEFKGSVCTIEVKDGNAVKALFTPAGQDGVTGTYPLA